MDDDELIRQCRQGRRDAFTALYQRYRSRLFSFCLTLVRNPSDAEDALQDIFRYVFSKLASYQSRGRFKSFVFQIAHSVSIDILRRRARQATLSEEFEIPFEPEEPPRAEQVDRLRACIARLPSMYREVLALRVLDDLSYDEIAEILELPLGTVKSRIHHAVAQVRNLLAEIKKESEFSDET